jgi:hypothetical protein
MALWSIKRLTVVLLVFKPPRSSLRSHYKVALWNHQSSEPQWRDVRTVEALCLLFTWSLPTSPQVSPVLTSMTVTLWHFFKFDALRNNTAFYFIIFSVSCFLLSGFGLVCFGLAA